MAGDTRSVGGMITHTQKKTFIQVNHMFGLEGKDDVFVNPEAFR